MSEDTENTQSGGNISKLSPDSKKKTFRCAAQTMAVTYPKCDLDPKEVTEALKKRRSYDHIAVVREYHKDDTPHIHVYVRWSQKWNMKDERALDIGRYHPNIQGCRNPQHWYAYIMKEKPEDAELDEDINFDFLNPHNFIKREADFQAMTMYLFKKKLKVFEDESITLQGRTFELKGKQRNILICADSNSGKTSEIEDKFEGYSIYKCTGQKFPFDKYDGERVLIYDDIIPKLQDVIAFSNVYKTITPVPGDTRYGVRYLPMKQERIQIMLLNTLPTYAEEPAFKTRFHILDLRTHKDQGQSYTIY